LRELAANATNAADTSKPDESTSLAWYGYILVILLVLLSAFCNGNNIGTMGMDEAYLELLTKGPFESVKDEREAYLASRVLPLRKKGNQLLVTILLGVAVANSSISIVLAEAEGNLSGFFISTVLTLIFGEILP
jgi:metal transporter CNNM